MNPLLKLLSCSLRAEKCGPFSLSKNEWEKHLTTASQQKILPLILDTALQESDIRKTYREEFEPYRDMSLYAAIRQVTQTNEFLTLILHAQEQGLDPIVLKGIICRNLYPKPVLRVSIDEDLLIPSEQIEQFHEFLVSEGLFSDDSEEERQTKFELSYHKESSPTYIEIHKTLFDPSSEVYGNFDSLFPNIFECTMRVQAEDVSILTLEPSAHLLYLILHAFKHFIHSGVGIRPVCDIGMFAEHYAESIQWAWIRESLESVNVFTYCKALFRIIQLYLLPDAKFYGMISDWKIEKIGTDALLKDILDSGIHGNASATRLHSSNITLDAVAAEKQGRKKSGIWHSLFPGKEYLKNHFAYAKKHPVLLPVAWFHRLLGYLKRNRGSGHGPGESVRIGKDRIRLLKQYGILEK